MPLSKLPHFGFFLFLEVFARNFRNARLAGTRLDFYAIPRLAEFFRGCWKADVFFRTISLQDFVGTFVFAGRRGKTSFVGFDRVQSLTVVIGARLFIRPIPRPSAEDKTTALRFRDFVSETSSCARQSQRRNEHVAVRHCEARTRARFPFSCHGRAARLLPAGPAVAVDR